MQSLTDIVYRYRYIHGKSLRLTVYIKNHKIFQGVICDSHILRKPLLRRGSDF